ncbi:hypothetical protein JCM1841_000782 [Sporobolomyces salmonicolor]
MGPGGGGGAYATAPSTPSGVGSPFARGGGTPVSSVNGGVRAALSPHTPAGRAPSPVRARSPDPSAARHVAGTARTTPKVASTPKFDGTEPHLLRGQSDPFPSSATSSTTATPISYLPPSVSVRKIHSPTLRSSQSSALQTNTSTASSIDTRTSSAPSLPALSSSPSSCTSSPLTSPSLRSQYEPPHAATLSPTTGLGLYDGSVGRKAGTGVRRASGMSSVSNSSSSYEISATNGGLLPPISIASEISLSPRPLSPTAHPLSSSPPLKSSPIHVTPNYATIRSPTLSSFPSIARPVKVPTSAANATVPSASRSPLASSNAPHQNRRTRPRSGTSTSSRSSVLSGHDDSTAHDPASSWGRATASFASLASSTAGTRDRGKLAEIDWSAESVDENGDGERRTGDAAGRDSTGSDEAASLTSAANLPLLREAVEKEIEAKVSRRILDLEIRNSSLLTVNASLERLKLKHTSEIRELRRRLRESHGGAALARFVPDEGLSDSSETDDADHDCGDDGDEPETTWEELLEGDKHFSAIASALESLVKRAKTAVEYAPSANEAGRVLSTVEMEDRLDEMSEGTDGDSPVVARMRGLGIPTTQQ